MCSYYTDNSTAHTPASCSVFCQHCRMGRKWENLKIDASGQIFIFYWGVFLIVAVVITIKLWQAVTIVACYCSVSQVRIFCFSFGTKNTLERFIVTIFSNFNSICEVLMLLSYKIKFNKEFITLLKSVIRATEEGKTLSFFIKQGKASKICIFNEGKQQFCTLCTWVFHVRT